MKIPTWFALLALMISLMPALAQADKTSDAKQAIQAQYAREIGAMMKKDVNTALSVNAPDFVYYRKNGDKGDRKKLRANMEQILAIASNMKVSNKIVKFTLNGNQAITTIQGHAEMVLPNRKTGKRDKLVIDDSSEDIWQNMGGKWLRKQTRILKDNATINGQTVPQP
jgi:hypothetical protein